MPIPPRYPLLVEMRLEQGYADRLRRLLLTASRQVQSDLNKLGDAGNPLTRMQLQAQKASLNAMMDRAYVDIHKALEEGQKEAAKAASLVVSRYENQLLELTMSADTARRVANSEARRAASGVEAALRRMEGTSYTPLSKSVYNTAKLSKGWVDDKINQALLSGWDAKRLAKEISSSIDPRVPGGVSYAANRLARTEINNAFHASAAKRYADSGLVEAVDWHLSSSHPEGDICDTFAAEGPYPVNKVPKKPHPHCYCFITPALPTEEQFMANLLAGKYDDERWAKDVSPAKVARQAAKTPPINKYAAAAAKAPKLKTVMDASEPEEAVAALNKVYGGRKYNGFDVEVTDADWVEDGIGVQMRISKGGKDAGFATRVFKDGGSVYHDTLELAEEFRGQGFSTAFSEFSEAYYRANNVTKIQLHAALENGSYTWAKAGYSWDDSFAIDEVAEGLQEHINMLSFSAREMDRLGFNDPASPFRRLREAWDDELPIAEWPTPAELANYTYQGKAVGKEIMNATGADWRGMKPMAG
jgi:GNAT superfamily N-acetyltransferase